MQCGCRRALLGILVSLWSVGAGGPLVALCLHGRFRIPGNRSRDVPFAKEMNKPTEKDLGYLRSSAAWLRGSRRREMRFPFKRKPHRKLSARLKPALMLPES